MIQTNVLLLSLLPIISNFGASFGTLPRTVPGVVLYGVCPAQASFNDTLDLPTSIRTLLREQVEPAMSPDCRKLGFCESNPAASCKKIAENNPDAPSGDYWVRLCNCSLVRVFCDMNNSRYNSTSGWMRVANVDMTDFTQKCPGTLQFHTPVLHLCEKRVTSLTCRSIFFPTYSLPFTRVCGRIKAYQEGSPDAFNLYYRDRTLTLDDIYLQGISITVGHPRTHVWSFVAARTEGYDSSQGQVSCSCANRAHTRSIVPPFVGMTTSVNLDR